MIIIINDFFSPIALGFSGPGIYLSERHHYYIIMRARMCCLVFGFYSHHRGRELYEKQIVLQHPSHHYNNIISVNYTVSVHLIMIP